jgi:hypothetical protein
VPPHSSSKRAGGRIQASNFAGKDSQPRIGKRWEDVGGDEVDMVVEVADEG